MKNDQVDTLIKLYTETSKHSNYQVLPSNLSALINDDTLQIKSRSEKERLKYIIKKVPVKNKSILDIGANTGFFTFELLDKGSSHVTVYEGNKAHADFIKYAGDLLNIEHKLDVKNFYYCFNEIQNEADKDITLLLNVLHHVGSDYANSHIDLNEAKEHIINSINNMSSFTKILVLQIGFNWHGDIKKPLFTNGTKKEMIDFISVGTKNCWEICSVGIAESVDSIIVYRDLDESNIKRNDKLGEFLNRPIFIMKSTSS